MDENAGYIVEEDGEALILIDGTSFISEDLALMCRQGIMVYITEEKELIIEPVLKWAGNPNVIVAVKAFGLQETVQALFLHEFCSLRACRYCRHHSLMLVAQWQNVVTRKDLAVFYAFQLYRYFGYIECCNSQRLGWGLCFSRF